MFTGLVQDIGTIQSIQTSTAGATLNIQTQLDTSDFALGESIAVDGCCLTVTSFDKHSFTVDCSPETMKVTAIGQRNARAKVHLERALRLGERLGGHIASGLIDGIGTVTQIQPDGNAVVITIAPPASLLRYMIDKGSIAIDGVSLTINTVNQDTFSIAVIPHTQKETRLVSYRVGTQVNLEVDQLGKYLEKLIQPWQAKEKQASKMDLEFLKEHGFTK